ncbi:archaea-specific SMC-related protein [Halomicrococcus sp. NG-SE-24]|uniref:archaea-specific SMC-related protein n=1 Tax=Halomicrococcus sp. NG-SE-24 TaxID=3436928 RepID=UPI003D966255
MLDERANSTARPPSDLGDLTIEIRNIGGISEAEVSFTPGVSLLSGKNASNKSSFLRALAAVLGGPDPQLKSDAREGFVRLETADAEYHVELTARDGGQVVSDANRFSDLEELCELFVALDETNPVRQAVINDGDLYELLMKPVDTEAIETEISHLKSRKDDIDGRLDELSRKEDRLPTLRTRANDLRREIEAVEESLDAKRKAIAERESDASPDDEEGVLDELRQKRGERETVRNRIQTQSEALSSLRDELEEISEQTMELRPSEGMRDIDAIETEIEQLHHQKQQLSTTINALSPIVEMNAQLLDDEDDIPEEMKSNDIVSELDPSSRTVTCWTCGNTVERSEITEQVRVVQEILEEKRDHRGALTDQISALKDEKRRIEQQRDERERLSERKRSIEAEIERREERLEELEGERSSLTDDIENLQSKAEEADDGDEELLELHSEVSSLEYERGQLENELEDIEAEIEEIESAIAERDDLEAERESVTTRLREQRDRIETIERDLVTAFNESMQQVIDRLAYENVERVWIERLTGADGKTHSRTDFELHVVRSTDDGAAYEDTIDTLSKSEREVVSLVVALAGYLAHEVATEIPIVVVDAVEMLDADRIRGLLTHFEQHADYVVAAVLPAEAGELDDTYPCIRTSSSFTAET